MVHRLFTHHFWHQLFEAGVFLKALNAVWEIALGIFLLANTHPMLRNHFIFLSREEFLGGRDDALFRIVTEQLNHFSVSARSFAGIYLFLHGLLNVFLAYNLYKKRLWAYPTTMGIISLFLVYQVYRLFHTHSLILLCVTVFDVAFVILTWYEYRAQLGRVHIQHVSA
jgi:uncharacterized membrane protein